MKFKKLDNKVALLKMFISGIIAFVFAMSYVMSVRAEHTVVKSDDGMAGDTAYEYHISSDTGSDYLILDVKP